MMGLVATVLLQLPLFKHVFAWMGCYPAGAAAVLRRVAQTERAS